MPVTVDQIPRAMIVCGRKLHCEVRSNFPITGIVQFRLDGSSGHLYGMVVAVTYDLWTVVDHGSDSRSFPSLASAAQALLQAKLNAP